MASKLTAPQVWYFPKNQGLTDTGEMFEWLIRDFYDSTSDEEERIRIWSQNIPSFHSKYLHSFNKESTLMMHPPQ